MRLGGTWFSEPPALGMQTHLQIRKVLHQRESEHQSIEVYDSVTFGRMLALDRTVQTTERDEFFYHEMLVHPAMMSHPAPKSVLIIGGGDGGALRRTLEHGVDRAVLCELDPQVVEVSKEYLPTVSAGAFDDPRSELRFEDGVAFTRNCADSFDVILVDAPDPVGPGKSLFEPQFLRALHEHLTVDGLVVVQSESPLYMPTQTASVHLSLREVFDSVSTYTAEIPSYLGVTWSFTMGMKGSTPDPATLAERFSGRGLKTSCYTPDRHALAHALPAYLRDYLAESIDKGHPSDRHPFFPLARGNRFVEQFWDKPT